MVEVRPSGEHCQYRNLAGDRRTVVEGAWVLVDPSWLCRMQLSSGSECSERMKYFVMGVIVTLVCTAMGVFGYFGGPTPEG